MDRPQTIDLGLAVGYEARNEKGRRMTVTARRQHKQRLPRGVAKERILVSAEGLFAASGVDGVTFRELASAAGVSLSATHYYFQSKHAVLAEVFARKAKSMTDRRAVLLEAASTTAGGPSLDAILDAFLRPAFEVTRGDRNDPFNKLRARLAVEQSEVTRAIVSTAFDESDGVFLGALARALPALSPQEIHWRFHFLVGALVYTIADAGQLEGLSQGLCTSADTDDALTQMVAAFTALFRGAGRVPGAAPSAH